MIANEYHSAGLSATRLARRLGLSVSHFGRQFRAHTGFAFAEYVKLVRLRSALSMLSHTRLPVRDVADAAGYSHLSSFDRDFRRVFGVTPRTVRDCTSMDVLAYLQSVERRLTPER